MWNIVLGYDSWQSKSQWPADLHYYIKPIFPHYSPCGLVVKYTSNTSLQTKESLTQHLIKDADTYTYCETYCNVCLFHLQLERRYDSEVFYYVTGVLLRTSTWALLVSSMESMKLVNLSKLGSDDTTYFYRFSFFMKLPLFTSNLKLFLVLFE